MHITIGNPCSNNQSVSMRMVHPSGVCLNKDNVFELSPSVLGWTFLSPIHMCLGRVSRFFLISVVCTATFPGYIWPINFVQHFLYPFWTPLWRLLLSVSCLGLIQELLKVPCPYEFFNLIFEGHTPLSIVPYILVEGTIFIDALRDILLFIALGCLYRFLLMTT